MWRPPRQAVTHVPSPTPFTTVTEAVLATGPGPATLTLFLSWFMILVFTFSPLLKEFPATPRYASCLSDRPGVGKLWPMGHAWPVPLLYG